MNQASIDRELTRIEHSRLKNSYRREHRPRQIPQLPPEEIKRLGSSMFTVGTALNVLLAELNTNNLKPSNLREAGREPTVLGGSGWELQEKIEKEIVFVDKETARFSASTTQNITEHGHHIRKSFKCIRYAITALNRMGKSRNSDSEQDKIRNACSVGLKYLEVVKDYAGKLGITLS